MECKIKALFISIALSFLMGNLIYSNTFTSKAEETPFGRLAETAHFYEDNLDWEELSAYQIISELHEGDALRHFPPTKRINNSSSSKSGLILTKRKQFLYTSPLTFESSRRFPSGLTEARQYLISLGKLII